MNRTSNNSNEKQSNQNDVNISLNINSQVPNNKDENPKANYEIQVDQPKTENELIVEKSNTPKFPINYQNNSEIELNDEKVKQDKSKRKKDWRSWSPQEKIMFYELIANGGNYSSLQKLFKTINDKIGTKSTEKIRDYYYRMLKNVNMLLQGAGEKLLNSKNRDEVILAITCYGKLLNTNGNKQFKLDMKKLNKHPRLFKKIANMLKKLMANKINAAKSKMITNKKYPQSKYLDRHNLRSSNKALAFPNNSGDPTEFSRIINLSSFRKIPYDTFNIRLLPYDQETYLKMIDVGLTARVEISDVAPNRPIKYIIEVLNERWKSVRKRHSKSVLYLIPVEQIWIPSELIIFSNSDSERAYDVGDIYVSYGSPTTNVLYMKYQWSETKEENKLNASGTGLMNHSVNAKRENETIFGDKNEAKDEGTSEEDGSDDDQGCEKPFLLDNELNFFDPLELLGFDDEKKNSTEEEDYNFRNDDEEENKGKTNYNDNRQNSHNNQSISNLTSLNNDALKSAKIPSTRKPLQKRIPFVNNVNNNNISIKKESQKTQTQRSQKSLMSMTNLSLTNPINNGQATNSRQLRTGYSEIFSHSQNNSNNKPNALSLGGIGSNLNDISSNLSKSSLTNLNNSNKIPPKANSKKKIPFINNVNKAESDELKHKKEEEKNLFRESPTRGYKEYSKDLNSQVSPFQNRIVTSSNMNTIYNLNINRNSTMFYQQPSNCGLTSLFNPDPIASNNTNFQVGNEMSNFIPQNSANYNSIFDQGTQVEFFRHNFSTSNLFKSEYPKGLNNEENAGNNTLTNTLPNHNPADANTNPNVNSTLNSSGKKRKRKEKKKEKKITIEEIEEIENKKRNKKGSTYNEAVGCISHNVNPNPSVNKSQVMMGQGIPLSNPYIINQNNYFTNYPGQYLQMMHLDIPHPSSLMEDKGSYNFYIQRKENNS